MCGGGDRLFLVRTGSLPSGLLQRLRNDLRICIQLSLDTPETSHFEGGECSTLCKAKLGLHIFGVLVSRFY